MLSKIRSMRKGKIFLSLGLFLSGFALTAFSQETGAAAESTKKWMKKPVFAFKLGGFFPSLSMDIRVDPPDGGEGTDVSLDKDLGVPKSGSTIRLDGDLRLAKWFCVAVNYYAFKLTAEQPISKEITIGDTVYPVNQTVKTTLTPTFINLDAKFYLLHRERLDFGVYAGVYATHLKLDFEAMEAGRRLLEIKKLWAPIPSVGLHFWYQPIPKMLVYAKAGYFKYNSKRVDYDSATFNLNLEYYFYKFLGIGGKYEYSDMKLNLSLAGYKGKIDYVISGFQAYVTLGF
jgi:hypothetical protein